MRILALAGLDGQTEGLDSVMSVAASERCEAIVVAGNLLAPLPITGNGSDRAQALHHVLTAFADAPCPVCIVPGENDGPERLVLPALFAEQWVARRMHCVHGSFTELHELSVAGFGGMIADDEQREVHTRLCYPGWEAMYRLSFVRELDRRPFLVFHQPPEESQTVVELLNTWRPRMAVVGGAKQGRTIHGDTVVVSPGSWASGRYAVVDENDRKAALV